MAAMRSEKAITTIQKGELRTRDHSRAGGVEALVSTAAMQREFSGMLWEFLTIDSHPNECLAPEERKNHSMRPRGTWRVQDLSLIETSSTSNIRVALGPISAPAPRSP